jgi:hypothetical protein
MSSFNTDKASFDNQKSTPFFSQLLRGLGSWGMDYSDMVFRNSQAKGINENPNNNQSTYQIFAEQAVGMFLDKKSLSYYDRAYPDKRNILREYSQKNEINKFVETIVNEAIVYDEKKYFCRPNDIEGNYSDNIKERIFTVFNKLYQIFELNDGKKALNLFKMFIIDGYLAFEIIYDDKRKNIIGFKILDPHSLVITLDPSTLKPVWIQFPDRSDKKILLDTQIIYIAYSDLYSGYTSYVEPLIRPYNLYRIIEETIVMYRITNATMYKKFVIPTDGLSKSQAKEAIAKLMATYEDKVEFDSRTGQININGKANIPYSKEIWLPGAGGQTPTVELVDAQGPNLLETDTIVYFYNALKRASSIPLTRLDQNNSAGGTIFQEVNEVTREELMFSRFIEVLRSSFVEILTKPLWIQMCLEFPELKDRPEFKADISIKYNKDNLYEEWKILTNLDKKTTIINNLLALKEDNEGSYFEAEYLIKKYMGLNSIDLQENEKIKRIRKADKDSTAGGEEPVM